MTAIAKNTICIWYNKEALVAAQFYAATFPDSQVGEMFYAPVTTHLGGKGMC